MRFLDFPKTDFLSDELPCDFEHFWKTHLIFFVFLIIYDFSRIFKKKVTFSSKRGLIYLVILSNFDFSLLIVRKCQCSCVFYAFSDFHFVSFTSRFRSFLIFSFDHLKESISFLSKFHQKNSFFIVFHDVFKKRLFFICFVTVFWFLKDFQLKSWDFWTFQKLIF